MYPFKHQSSKFIAALLGSLCCLALQAQVSLYSFSETAATYTAVSGTVIHAAGWNDPAPVSVPIPFTFTFNSVGYTSCSVNGNGYITFGATVSAAAGTTPVSVATGYNGAVSAMGIDLISNSSVIEYATTGIAPNRVFVVQWSNCRRVADNNAGADWNFQIRLLETSNVIQVRYGTCGATNATNTIVSQIGLRGATNADFNNRRKTTASSWALTTTAGTLNTHTVLSRSTALPPSGRTFIWTPSLITNSCDPNGNVIIYSNYDGGILNINVDQNIPNLKIGVCTYEGVTINISGTFAANVTEVRYVGFNGANAHCSGVINTSINGAPAAVTSVSFYPSATMTDPNGSSNMVCGYSCSTGNQGGCNTAGQIAHYFLTQFGGTLRYHFTQYGCWASSYLVSSGGNCCFVNQVLPVELNYFTAVCDVNGNAQLVWETATETNNHYFTLERSDDGSRFYTLATLNGAGNSSSPSHYSFTDQSEHPAVVYYRLRQTDYNGASALFPVRVFNRESCMDQANEVSVFPNPALHRLVLQWNNEEESPYTIEVRDLLGRVMLTQYFTPQTVSALVVLQIDDLPQGTYIVSLYDEEFGKHRHVHFVKQ
ncbi:MAG: T9SS type A sorting domain-containing protein [Bacteroidetes bacterium]|nr:T9SS type A sorting domain-containing protein [Bacteroidota bacterium]